MIEISEKMHENPTRSDADKLEDELAHIVAELYELSNNEFNVLKQYWDFIRTRSS